ncbi:TonB-dependent receptor family protein [Cerasicoccus arenae]|uniref:Amino acid ABC transporter substrate-binding protein n=1 Tax=Cerasicoccus arenae TaxID=424488 RepID=A0A8J3DA52_9BACT|nr:TonB-dependent receptor [Cerasicoccus arenae]MBK1859339.1 TonB-dependent receptor [Cerasicoccus arenae]GHB93849.1 amino acid ABC transporter substrate-binding protein [Cerasicoccus arenae]
MNRITAFAFSRSRFTLLLAGAPLSLLAQASQETIQELEPVVMEAPVAPSEQLFLPEIQGAKIMGAKKTTNVVLEDMPEIVQNNMREVFITTPGVNVAEEAIPARSNISYRGIGDPHESESVLVLKDGIPLESDWFGYPTIYYIPPIESVERVEFIRGGGALLYGPQVGPVFNYITASPREDTEFGGSVQGFGGSYGYYSTYLESSGTNGQFGYGVDFLASGADGVRNNADYSIQTGSATVTYQIDEKQSLRIDFDAYSSNNGEGGRLTTLQWDANPNTTTTPIDRVWIQRYFPSLNYIYELEDGLIDVKSWVGYQDRFSRRASGGTLWYKPSPPYAAPTTNTPYTNLDRKEFYFVGLDARLRKDYDAGFTDGTNTFTAGATFYYGNAPNIRENGVGTGTTGPAVYDVSSETIYGAVFAENLFRFGRWAVIPAFRLDLPTISTKENYNYGAVDPFTGVINRPLFDETITSVAPLGSLGITYDININNQLYTSFATSYTPKKYTDLGNPTSNRVRSADANVAYNYQGELGARGSYSTWFSYDGSVFYNYNTGIVETLNIGGGNTQVSNAGDAVFFGIEAAIQGDLFAFIDAQAGTKLGEQVGALSLFANVQLLDAQFTSGQFNGNTPSYAPNHIVKTGVVWDWDDFIKVALTGQFVDDQYWNDANNNTGNSIQSFLAGGGAPWVPATVSPQKIPAFMVWDFSVEISPIEHFTVLGGISNLLDEQYYSRVRGGGGGIEPLDGRTYYAGARFDW